MNIWESKVFKIHTKMSQSLLRSKLLQNTSSYKSKGGNFGVKVKYGCRPIPDPYTPIHASDIPLDKLLELRPQYRYGVNLE